MSKKTPHRALQRLVEDEIGKPPKLGGCANLIQANPKRHEESREQWISRVWLENEAHLRASAGRRE